MYPYLLSGLWGLAIGVAGAPGEPYDPAQDPTVNPLSLFAPAPEDASRIADEEWLIRHLRAEPSSLNPILLSSGHELQVTELLFDEPVVYDAHLHWTLNPAMAESYLESPDGRTATLTLKPGLTWQDGTPLTAEDVAFSWRAIVDDQVPAVGARAGVDPIAECNAVSPRIVAYRFKEARPTNRWSVKFPIIPKHIYTQKLAADPTLSRSDYHVEANRHPIGNGPYRLVEWKSGERLTLERWPEYPGPKPHFARVVFKIVPDGNVALLLFKSGQLDELSLTAPQFVALSSDEQFQKVGVRGWAEQAVIYCIAWNADAAIPFFTDARVRRALSHALNLPRIRANVFNNLYPRCRGIFPPQSWAYNPDVELYDYNPKEAARLLDDAGWHIDPEDGWRYRTMEKPDGEEVRTRFAFTLCFAQESKTSPQLAVVLQEDLKKLGVEMTLQALEYTALKEKVLKRDFDATVWAWTATPEPDDARELFHSDARRSGRNFVGYSNPRVDELFDQARRSFDPQERRRCYQQIARLVYEDAPYTFVVNAPSLWAFHRRLHGVRFSAMGPFGFYPGGRDWWVAREDRLRGR